MAKPAPIKPPFAWLGRYWTPVGLGLVAMVAAIFRFYQLQSLPPGLDDASARIGVQALRLGTQNWAPHLNADNGYAPLWVWLQALSVHLFGHTALALRLWPALLGTLGVLAVWFWLRNWFGLRIAWTGSFIMAVSPWAVTVSRNGVESALLPLLVPLSLWLAGRAYHRPSATRYALLGAALGAELLSGPIGWLAVLGIFAAGAFALAARHELMKISPARATGAGVFALAAAAAGYLLAHASSGLAALPQNLSLTSSPATLFTNLVKVLLMFNVHGDENYRHNLAGVPMLNAFVGLMLITGLLVSISRLHQLRYRVLLMMTFLLLLPAVFTTTGLPNSSWAVGAMPLIFGLAAIGTAYMLELWYATFPINSAARATGQAAIILLLALTLLQG